MTTLGRPGAGGVLLLLYAISGVGGASLRQQEHGSAGGTAWAPSATLGRVRPRTVQLGGGKGLLRPATSLSGGTRDSESRGRLGDPSNTRFEAIVGRTPGATGIGNGTSLLAVASAPSGGDKAQPTDERDATLAWWKNVFFWGSIIFAIIVAMVTCAFCGWACCFPSGRSRFFKKDVHARLKAELLAKMPDELKEYVESADFKAKVDKRFLEYDVDSEGKLEWNDEFREVIVADYGIGVMNHELFKELVDDWTDDPTITKESFANFLWWLEFIKKDFDDGGVPESQIAFTDKPPEEPPPEEDEKEDEESAQTPATKV